MTFWPAGSPFRLRFSVENASDPITTTFELRVSKNGGAYQSINAGSSNVRSADASTDTDETPVNVHQLSSP